jgi:uncharacterized protein with HEPN domain
METTITITLSDEGKLQLPPEMRQIFADGEQYSVITKDDRIIFQKVPKLTWDELRKKREELVLESEEMTTEEICKIVREVRKEMKK